MSAKSSIEWTDASWNPVRGCSLKSEGCRSCYAMKQAHRFSGKGQHYEGLTMIGQHGPLWTGTVKTVPGLLDAPLHWKNPRRIFVNSMSDLFHEDVPVEFIDSVFAVMALAPQHIYQILTKRPARTQGYAAQLLDEGDRWSRFGDAVGPLIGNQGYERAGECPWPLPNVHLGVSVENQQTADERIPLLLQTPAAVRFVSAEPLLGPVDLTSLPIAPDALLPEYGTTHGFRFNALHRDEDTFMHSSKHHLDWVIVGGESGPGARACDVAWIRSIKGQCLAADVPVFIKQLGSRPFVVEGSQAAQEWSASGASAVMDDCGLIHTKDKKGGDVSEWPEDLRVREFQRVQA